MSSDNRFALSNDAVNYMAIAHQSATGNLPRDLRTS
jgi:hypothetical protein